MKFQFLPSLLHAISSLFLVPPLDVAKSTAAAPRAHLSVPSLRQVGPRVDCGATFLGSPTFLLQWSVRRQTTLAAEDTLSWHLKREGWSRACKHIQAAVASWSLTFHGNASPGVFLRALKVWSWRARAKQGDASNGERLNQSLKFRYGTSNTSFLSVELKRQINGYLIVLALFLFIYFFLLEFLLGKSLETELWREF